MSKKAMRAKIVEWVSREYANCEYEISWGRKYAKVMVPDPLVATPRHQAAPDHKAVAIFIDLLSGDLYSPHSFTAPRLSPCQGNIEERTSATT